MNAARISRVGHRWLALIVGLQLVAWSLSGLYMVSVDIDFIHGDTLVHDVAPPVRLDRPLAPLASVRAGRDDTVAIHLRTLPDDGQTVYEVVGSGGDRTLFDATNASPLSPLGPQRVRSLAAAYYAGQGRIAAVRLLEDDADIPGEIRGRRAPLWRVEFDDWLETTLYVHPDTGRLVTRRHRLWRWFDFFWSLHIMDYREREDVNNPLLRVATPLALVTASLGVWLAFCSFEFLQRRRQAQGEP
jgi:uncharacterized iron-regulated membrane protein